jgi:hypothetical protein
MRRRLLSLVAVAASVGLLASLLLVPTAAAARTRTMSAQLTGEKEVPGPGDGNGVGAALVRTNWQKRRVCFSLIWRRLGPVSAAHIHKGTAAEAGPIVVELFVPQTPLPRNIRALSGCAYKVPGKLIGRINRHPKRYYVNVHTKGYPEGAIRGQLKHA